MRNLNTPSLIAIPLIHGFVKFLIDQKADSVGLCEIIRILVLVSRTDHFLGDFSFSA